MKSRMSVSGAAGVLLLAPFAVGAQVPARQPSPRTSNVPGGNMCLQLSAGPSRLSSSPEGQAFIRMRAELEAAERATSSDSSRMRRIVIVRGTLDTLGRMITGTVDPAANRFFVDIRPGTPITVDGQRVDGQRVDPSDPQRMMVSAKLRELQPQVAELTRGGAPTIFGTVDIRLNTLGYVGLSASAGTFPMSIDPMEPFAYCDYPRVESVEPGSPADKAGLMTGDTLIAYNGRDLRQTNVNYPDLLQPGKRLSIRYRRDGRNLLANMIVAPRDPERVHMLTSIGACTEAEAANGCRSDRVVMRAASKDTAAIAAMAGAVASARKMPPSGASAGGYGARPVGAGTAVPATGTRTPLVMYDGSGGIRFAGALLRAIDEQTAQNMGGAEAGLFVIELPPTTSLSYQAGLRGGDWVISANGMTVRDISTFMKAFEVNARERLMTMQVTSKTAGARTVTIRW